MTFATQSSVMFAKPDQRTGYKINVVGQRKAICEHCGHGITEHSADNVRMEGASDTVWIHNATSLATCQKLVMISPFGKAC